MRPRGRFRVYFEEDRLEAHREGHPEHVRKVWTSLLTVFYFNKKGKVFDQATVAGVLEDVPLTPLSRHLF